MTMALVFIFLRQIAHATVARVSVIVPQPVVHLHGILHPLHLHSSFLYRTVPDLNFLQLDTEVTLKLNALDFYALQTWLSLRAHRWRLAYSRAAT